MYVYIYIYKAYLSGLCKGISWNIPTKYGTNVPPCLDPGIPMDKTV